MFVLQTAASPYSIMCASLKTDLLCVVTFLIMIRCMSSENDCFLKTFALSLVYSDMNPESNPIKDITASMGTECATHCYRDVRCTGFIINSVDGLCSMYDRRYQSMAFANQSGTLVYGKTKHVCVCVLELVFSICVLYITYILAMYQIDIYDGQHEMLALLNGVRFEAIVLCTIIYIMVCR